MRMKNKGGSQDLQRNHIPPRILQYIIFPFWCVLNVRTEHDFVSGLCWLNIRENRKKDLQLEKLQKKYILSSSKRQTLLNCSGGLALGFVSWWKRKWPNWGGVWSMRGRWRQLSRRSCRYPIIWKWAIMQEIWRLMKVIRIDLCCDQLNTFFYRESWIRQKWMKNSKIGFL